MAKSSYIDCGGRRTTPAAIAGQASRAKAAADALRQAREAVERVLAESEERRGVPDAESEALSGEVAGEVLASEVDHLRRSEAEHAMDANRLERWLAAGGWEPEA